MNAIVKLIKLIVDAFSNKPTVDIPSPRDITPQESIKYLKDKQRITIDGILPEVWITTVQDTNSMDGLLDYGHTVILSNNPAYLEFIEVGDVIVWNIGEGDVIHQIIEISRDARWYCYTKGINNSRKDPYKIRREHIKWLGLGIVW